MKSTLKLFSLLILIFCQQQTSAQTLSQKRVLVYFMTGAERNAPPNQNTATVSSPDIIQMLTNFGLSTSSVTPSFPDFNEADTINFDIGESSRQMNYAKVFSISLPDTSFRTALIDSLLTLSEVLYAEEDGESSTDVIPADGRFGQQWNMSNPFLPGADIHAEDAWDIFTGNPNAIIAIVDAGVDVAHNDLAAKITGGDNGFQIGNAPIIGQFSHGSHVAGIAAAVTNNNNNNGVAGVDWQARLHSRFVIGNNGDAGVAQGINNAINFSPNVWTLNHSWGLIRGFDGNGNAIPGRYSTIVRSAFARAYRNNRVSCVAMGNHQAYSGGIYANQAAFPAGFNSGLIAVGATDITDQVANFSANGLHIDVAAPGVDILSTNFNNGYVELDGTSMAAPHVSGLASLLKGFNTNLANDDIEQIIRLSADDANANALAGFDNQMGTGRINAERALQFLQAPNILQQLSITGGTVVNISGLERRIFLGVPGLRDGNYWVRRREVRTNITFPAMCNFIGVWGRGVGTTGFREENGRCYGEGVCEVVPGTVTNTGATLRTWIYEVWTLFGQNLGFYPTTANNVIFQYTLLGTPVPVISGDDAFCTTSNSYSITNLTAGSSLNWIASPSGIVTVNSPNSPTTTLTRITNGKVSLTATVTNFCPAATNVVKANILVGAPSPIDGVTTDYVMIHCNVIRYKWTIIGGDGATSFRWYIRDYPTGSFTQFAIGRTANSPFGDGTCDLTEIYVEAINACNPSSMTNPISYTFLSDKCTPFEDQSCSGYAMTLSVSPNPTDGNVQIKLQDDKEIKQNQQRKIKMVRVVNQNGELRKQISGNLDAQMNINIAELPRGIYAILVFDGKNWLSKKVIKN